MNRNTDDLRENRLNRKKILVIGSTCVDIIIQIDHLPRTEEDIHPTGQSLSLGGCAYNVANMIRLFNAPLTFISPVGTGFYGEYVEKALKKRGFEVFVHVPDRENGCCYCLVEKGGERTFMSCHGAEYTFDKKCMEPFENTDFDMVYVCGLEIEEPTGLSLIEYLEQHPKRELFYAPGPRGIQISREKRSAFSPSIPFSISMSQRPSLSPAALRSQMQPAPSLSGQRTRLSSPWANRVPTVSNETASPIWSPQSRPGLRTP